MLRTFADGRLFGSLTGDATPRVLALHGWGRTHHDFDAVLRPSGDAPPLDAVALDLPGFGATPPPPEPWGSLQYAQFVAPVLEEMQQPVVVVAHSFGGRLAVHLATLCSAQVGALVLTGVPLLRLGPPRQPARAYRLVRSLHRLGLIDEERMERARQRYGSADYRAAQGVMRQVHGRQVQETYEQQLDAIAVPVTMVWGEDDATVPLAVATAALVRLRDGRAGERAELVVCPGAGHLLPLTAPGALRRAVERHLA